MSRRPCPQLAADWSALVDGALTGARRERLLAHLVHCEPCRDEVAALRHVRAVLRRPAEHETPRDLTARLVAIAGPGAGAPLESRPFRRTAEGSLAARRRRLRVRATAGVVALGALVVGAGATGYAAAPQDALVAVGDPAPRAQAAFSATLSQFPLADDALGAVATAGPGADLAAPAVGGPVDAVAGTSALTADEARAALDRAAAAADTVAYTGVQAVRSRSGGQTVQATVRVRAVPGQGVQAEVLDGAGQRVSTGFAPAARTGRMVDDSLLRMLDRRFDLRAWSGAQALGRSATLVEAGRDGRRAARWWVDDATGLVLARQTFDGQGAELTSVAFSALQVSRGAALLEHLPVKLVVPSTGTALTLSATEELVQQGWVCREELAGLSLVRLRSDPDPAAGAVHLVYTDGLTTLGVVEQRGRLTSAPQGSSWDTALRAHTTDGATRLASWQSGSTVFTVVTDGSAEALAAAVASLPHEAPPERTTMERIREGWGKLLADTKG